MTKLGGEEVGLFTVSLSTPYQAMAHLQASQLFSVQDRVVVITGGGSGK